MPSPDRSGTLPGSPSLPAARGGLPCGRSADAGAVRTCWNPPEHDELWGLLAGPAPARLSPLRFPIPPLVTRMHVQPSEGVRSKGNEGKERFFDWRRNKVSVGMGDFLGTIPTGHRVRTESFPVFLGSWRRHFVASQRLVP